MAANPKPPSVASNGVITGPIKGPIGGNRKKQKRRAKQAAKQATQPPLHPDDANHHHHHADVEYDEDPLGYGEEDYDYSDAEADHYHEHYTDAHNRNGANGVHSPPAASKKKSKKKKSSGGPADPYAPDMLPPMPHPPPPSEGGALQHSSKGGGHHIWNTSTQQERQNIKDFWLSLSEDERKGLLKIEKEAVLKKMKQQQKHSCSCTVCGRKRTAIEEELEVLYEGYYEELEQYAHHDHPPLPAPDAIMPKPLQHRHPHPLAIQPPALSHHRTSHVHEHLDEDELSEEEDYISDEEEYSDEDVDGEVARQRAYPVDSFFNFGAHLTVKGMRVHELKRQNGALTLSADNLLTVADDLLKNDGRKFIEMMEQLAERRMKRETLSRYEADNHSSYPPNDGYSHEDPLAAGDEYDDEDEESYASGYDDEEDLGDEEEDEMVRTDNSGRAMGLLADRVQGGLTEEQRMQEGRRMFQIFAARMFEQRVLTAYREKVAAERQRKLLEELDDEDKLQAQREAKKQRDAQKKKDKKKQQAAARAEEKAKRDAEKAEEEARLREAEEKKQEEQRRKKEEQRKKREDEKRKQDEERARKEAERLQRQQEEQQRREEAERRAREQKAAEKARKEEARKREREEREARDKESRDRKAQEDSVRKEREAKSVAERAARDREKTQHPPQITKRPSQPGMVAIPGMFPKASGASISSPHPSVATPAVPKAPTPAKVRQPSQQGSHASSPKQAQSQVSSAPSKSSSPGSVGQPVNFVQPKVIMQKPGNQQHTQHAQPLVPAMSPLNAPHAQHPPGINQQQHPGNFAPPMGFHGFQAPPAHMMHNNMGPRSPFGMMPPQLPPMGVPNRVSYSSMNGATAPPPGMMQPPNRVMGFPFDTPGQNQPPPGFGQQIPRQPSQPSLMGQANDAAIADAVRANGEKDRFEPVSNQPIARPAPIQRPSSVKPQEHASDVDDLSRHLGSSALLDDTDEPLPSSLSDVRRASNVPTGGRSIPGSGMGQIGGGFGAPAGGFGTPSSSWNTPSLPFGQGSGLSQPGWGSLPIPGGSMNSWAHNQAAYSSNSAFGSIGAPPSHHRPAGTLNRPLTIRLAICQACKQLTTAARGEGDGYHAVDVLLRQIEHNRPMLDAPPTLREIEEICETEGDGNNGGGELSVRKSTSDAGGMAVKWSADAATPDHQRAGHVGLGEIGSPMPSKTSPVVGFGAPGMGRAPGGGGFQSFGAAVGSGGT